MGYCVLDYCEDSSLVDGKTANIAVKLLQCNPPKINVKLTIKEMGINYEQNFDYSTGIPIPGSSLADLYMDVKLDKYDYTSKYVNIKVCYNRAVSVLLITFHLLIFIS